MIVNKANIQAFFVGLQTLFQNGLDGYEVDWNKIATEVTSQTATENYGWLGQASGIREWVGDRVIHSMQAYGYAIRNRKFEQTIGVSRDDIEDNQIAGSSIVTREMGTNVAQFPDELVFPLLKNGFTGECYDGQNFFDTDHPVIDKNGNENPYSNHLGGTGTAWYLLSTQRAIRPLIYQVRRKFNFVSKTNLTDDNVFDRDEFVFGVDGRANAGYGLWQLAIGSKQPLDKSSFEAAMVKLRNMPRDGGGKLNIRPNLLVVPPTLRGAANDLIGTEKLAGGASNTLFKVVDVLDSPWLEA